MNDNTTYITLTEANFQKEVLEGPQPIVVDFWADWCGPCHMMSPIIEQLADEFQGQAKVGKLNVDDSATLATRYGIRSIPTLLFFKDGQIRDQLLVSHPRAYWLINSTNSLRMARKSEKSDSLFKGDTLLGVLNHETTKKTLCPIRKPQLVLTGKA